MRLTDQAIGHVSDEAITFQTREQVLAIFRAWHDGRADNLRRKGRGPRRVFPQPVGVDTLTTSRHARTALTPHPLAWSDGADIIRAFDCCTITKPISRSCVWRT
jgi:hypothetical protein